MNKKTKRHLPLDLSQLTANPPQITPRTSTPRNSFRASSSIPSTPTQSTPLITHSSSEAYFPFNHSISDLALAYLDELVVDHTPVNLAAKVAREAMRMIPVPPDLQSTDDHFYSKETLINAILGIYDFICKGDEDRLRSMLDTLL